MDTPTHAPSASVSTNVGREQLVHAVPVKVFTRNWSGTLLIGVVEEAVAKSSICRDTAYHRLVGDLPL